MRAEARFIRTTKAMTRDRWRDIRALIEQSIQDGTTKPGEKLPTEQELARIYGAGRHSVRRAVADLAASGHLSVEQGRGTFVLPRPMIDYTISRRTRLRRNLVPQGMAITGEILSADRIGAPARVAKALGLPEGAPVVATVRRSLADGLPVSCGTLYHDATRFGDFPERRREAESTTAVYQSYGIRDYLRGETRIRARPATEEEARLLHQHPDMPVLVVRATDRTPDGTPIAHSESVWSAARVTFSMRADEED